MPLILAICYASRLPFPRCGLGDSNPEQEHFGGYECDIVEYLLPASERTPLRACYRTTKARISYDLLPRHIYIESCRAQISKTVLIS